MLCNQFSDHVVDASSSVLEFKEPGERKYLPMPEIKVEPDTADLFPDPNSNNARGAWLTGVDSEVLDKRIEEIEKEERLNPPKKPFQKKAVEDGEDAPEGESENNSDEENSDDDNPPSDDNVGDDDAEKAGEDILNIDEEVGDADSGDGEDEQPEEDAPKKKSSFSGMWQKNKPAGEDAEASEEE